MPTSSSSSGSGGCAFVGKVTLGSNSSDGGDGAFSVGQDATGDMITGQRVWDADLSDALDSNWVPVELTGSPGGGQDGVTWDVEGGTPEPLSYSGAKYGAIQKVQITAQVNTANCRMSWRSVAVMFYRNGELRETVDVGDQPIADTISNGDSQASQTVPVVPNGSDNDQVVIAARVRLESTATALPAPDAITGEVRVFA